MKAPKILLLVVVVLVAAAAVALAGCGTKAGPTSQLSTPSSAAAGTEQNVNVQQMPQVATGVQQTANDAVRKTNLRAIDTAIQSYNAMNGSWPTAIQQLVPQFLMSVPNDPGGGTYYILMQNGQAVAAVK